MNTRFVYVLALVLIVSAWFSKGPISQPKKTEKEVGVPVTIVKVTEDPGTLGIVTGEMAAGGICNIEFINDVPFNNSIYDLKNRTFRLVGWAMDEQKERLPEKVVLRLTNSKNKLYYAIAKIGLVRSDVKEHFKLSDRILKAGFDLNVDTHNLPSDVYSLILLLRFEDRTYLCDNGRKVNLK